MLYAYISYEILKRKHEFYVISIFVGNLCIIIVRFIKAYSALRISCMIAVMLNLYQ